MELGGIEEDKEVVGFRGFFLVIMWWLFLVDVAVVGGFWRLKFCFFFPSVVAISCGWGCGCCWWWIW